MFGGLGIWELMVIFLIVLLFFGAKRLPEIGGSLGKGIREFKDSLSELDTEGKKEIRGGKSAEGAEGNAPPPRDDTAES